MSDAKHLPIGANANHGLIGLGPAPWGDFDAMHWPTDGYDATLAGYDWQAADRGDVFGWSTFTREDWLALGDDMIARWTAWRAHIATLPAGAASPEEG